MEKEIENFDLILRRFSDTELNNEWLELKTHIMHLLRENEQLKKMLVPHKKRRIREIESYSGSNQIFARTISGQIIVLNVPLYITIEELKMIIEDKLSYPMSHQRLIYAGSQLDDTKTLKFYQIKHNSTIQIMLRLSGD